MGFFRKGGICFKRRLALTFGDFLLGTSYLMDQVCSLDQFDNYNQMYNLSNQIQKEHGASITHEQLTQVTDIDDYLSKNKVPEVLNEALAKLIETRPEKVKEGLIAIFKAIKDNQHYFKKSDFEHMFEAYDFFEAKGGNQVPYIYLMQGLEKINISYDKETFLNTYPQFKLDRLVKKLDFINIMEGEYKQKIGA